MILIGVVFDAFTANYEKKKYFCTTWVGRKIQKLNHLDRNVLPKNSLCCLLKKYFPTNVRTVDRVGGFFVF